MTGASVWSTLTIAEFQGGKTTEEHLILLPVREFPDRGTKWLVSENFTYILIEHQSTPVLSMGFRILFYMTLIWDRQRQEWQRASLPESEWRFRPIVPILFYTGDRDWDTPLSVTALMDLPQELERFVPSHDTLFLNLPATASEDLTAQEHPFGWIARVLQKEKAPDEAFMNELRQAVERIDQLTAENRAEWQKAIHYLLLLIFHRREPDEHEPLTHIISQSVHNRQRQEEGATWDERLHKPSLRKVNKEADRAGKSRLPNPAPLMS